MNLIAFDPGMKGGIAIHHQGITTAHPMPLAGKILDLPSIADLVRSHSPSMAVIEKVGAMPGQGVWTDPRVTIWDGDSDRAGHAPSLEEINSRWHSQR
jgi:hypothetical protein